MGANERNHESCHKSRCLGRLTKREHRGRPPETMLPHPSLINSIHSTIQYWGWDGYEPPQATWRCRLPTHQNQRHIVVVVVVIVAVAVTNAKLGNLGPQPPRFNRRF